MGKEYGGVNTFTYYTQLIKSALKDKLSVSDVVNSLTSEESNKPLSALQGKILADKIGADLSGVMKKSEYDSEGNGVVNDSRKLGGLSPEAYAKPDDISAAITAQKGQANGLAPLGSDSKIDAEYLPSYVDDVVEGYFYEGVFYSDERHTQSIKGERGKIYVDITEEDGATYRWSGSVYIKISSSSDLTEMSNEEIDEIWESVFST